MKTLKRVCPICDNKRGEVLHTLKMEMPKDIPLANQFDIVCCDKCGFTYADTVSNQKDFDIYYAKHNVYNINTEIKNQNKDLINDKRCEILEKYVDKEKRILDIGCGSGDLLYYLQKKGYKNISGLDPSKDSISVLGERGIKGSIGNIFDEVPLNLRHKYDMVMCTAVMEHLYDIENAVDKLTQYINDQGYIFADVPAVEGFEKYHIKLPNYFNHEHINYFSLFTLDRLFAKFNFLRVTSEEESYYTAGKQPELIIRAIYKLNKTDTGILNCKDTISKKSILNYLKKELNNEKKEQDKISELISSNDKIVVWGTGSYCMQLLGKMTNIEDKISFFIDNNSAKWGQTIQGIKIHRPDKLLADKHKYPILICSIQNSIEIQNQIKSMNISNKCILM